VLPRNYLEPSSAFREDHCGQETAYTVQVENMARLCCLSPSGSVGLFDGVRWQYVRMVLHHLLRSRRSRTRASVASRCLLAGIGRGRFHASSRFPAGSALVALHYANAADIAILQHMIWNGIPPRPLLPLYSVRQHLNPGIVMLSQLLRSIDQARTKAFSSFVPSGCVTGTRSATIRLSHHGSFSSLN